MKRIVIIGGGVAGITAGIYGQLCGYDCTVLEKNSFTGGNLSAWERRGCTLDNCLHWLTGTKDGSTLNSVWKTVGMLGGNVSIVKGSAFYSSEYMGKRISLHRDPEKTLEAMLKLSKEDAKESKRFINAVKTLAHSKGRYEKFSAAYLKVLTFYGKMSLGELSQRFFHPLLKKLMTDYLSEELCALALVFAYSDFISGDADVPYGASGAAAERMERRLTSLGGRIITDCEAEKIVLESGRAIGVLTYDGRFFECDFAVCATDTEITFGSLLPKDSMPKKLAAAYRDKENMQTFSALHAAFVCDSRSDLPQNPLITEISPIRICGRQVRRMMIKPYTNKLLKIPAGKTVLQVMFFLYEDEAKKIVSTYNNDRECYKAFKRDFENAIKKRLVKRFPSVANSIKTLDVWTPASYRRYFGNSVGAFMSFAMKKGKSMLYRLPSKLSAYSNVFLATQWQGTPGGLPMAALNGKRAVEEIQKADRKVPVHAFSIRGGVSEI